MNLEEFVKKHKNSFDDKKMPELVSLDFEAKLKKELHQVNSKGRRSNKIKYLLGAATIALLASLGFWCQIEKQKNEIRDNLVSNLGESETNSMRLEAIYEIEDRYAKEDDKILNAFFKILHDDSDVNSKVAVIDALLKFPDNALVRNEFIEVLGNEKEPLVQLKLIKSIAKLREQRAKEPLKKIIEDEDSLPLVKGNASALLALLNQ